MNRAMLLVASLGASACGTRPPAEAARKPADTVTTRARQEAIGNSGIPGARGINKALQASDSAAARNQRLDSIGR